MIAPLLRKKFPVILCLLVFLASSAMGQAQRRRTLPGHVPAVAAALQPAALPVADTNLYLAIGLPLRNPETLSNLIEKLSDPADPNFHHWLTSEQFTEQFGPTGQDYQKVIAFAQKNGLKIVGTHPNRLLVDVTGPVANIEHAFQVRMKFYRHPTENRTFYAPDAEPTVDADIPILHVGNLNNYEKPRPLLRVKTNAGTNQTVTPYATGSGPGGDFTGKDFRAAYAGGVTNTGAGQYVAIVDVGGPYYTNDIYLYQSNANLSFVFTNILLSGSTGIPPGPNDDDGEETLDIDMAGSMAPGATILNYEGLGDDVFARIASDNLAKQITLSYGFGIDANINQSFLQFAAQGQSFFQASGDGGADLPGGTGLTGMPYATIVGGTSLTTTGAGGPWQSETTWGGSGGGISGYGIPNWQQGINMAVNQGSTFNRNYPDVAMLADVVIFWYLKNGSGGTVGGTSASSPQWAGFMALVNEAAASQGNNPVGFLNPVIYSIGKGPNYATSFHDITTGNNFNPQNPGKFAATTGYDLGTGWGSPRGSNTIAALVGFGTNDFSIIASPNGMNVVRGGVATSVLQVARMNQFAGTIGLAISGLPAGVTASFSPSSSTTNTVFVTLNVDANAAVGSANATITATSGALVHTLTLNFTVTQPIPNSAQASLSTFFNRGGFYSDGATFGGGLDGIGAAFSASLLGPRPSLRNILFNLGPPNANNVISCAGQIITLPAGQYSTLQMLACAINGNQPGRTFTVTYTDSTTTTLTQGISDWFTPQNYPSESILSAMLYRNNSNGTKDARTFNLYNYSLTIDPARTVQSITLPATGNVMVFAISAANAPASATLASFYNRPGMYTDGATFTNPPTGGIDGGGAAYSATLLGGSQVFNGVQLNFGPPNVNNVISCASQTIPVTNNHYLSLRMLATAVQGNQPSQSFQVTYTDATTATFLQSLSDWFSPQNYPRESKAVIMGHRNSSDGTKDNRTFYLYGYSFNLNAAKTVQSVHLPANANVIVTSISLVPDSAPAFLANPFNEPDIVAGQAYSGTIATNANDFDNDAMTFSKSGGPAWLSVSGTGSLSGTPLSSDVGANSFVVSVADPGGLNNTATMNITVTAAPPIVMTASTQDTNLVFNWSGGIEPYQIQSTGDLASGVWTNVGGPTGSTSLLVAPTNDAAFYRILGQ